MGEGGWGPGGSPRREGRCSGRDGTADPQAPGGGDGLEKGIHRLPHHEHPSCNVKCAWGGGLRGRMGAVPSVAEGLRGWASSFGEPQWAQGMLGAILGFSACPSPGYCRQLPPQPAQGSASSLPRPINEPRPPLRGLSKGGAEEGEGN